MNEKLSEKPSRLELRSAGVLPLHLGPVHFVLLPVPIFASPLQAVTDMSRTISFKLVLLGGWNSLAFTWGAVQTTELIPRDLQASLLWGRVAWY